MHRSSLPVLAVPPAQQEVSLPVPPPVSFQLRHLHSSSASAADSHLVQVVSIRIPAIEQSAVGDALFYYEKQTPEEVAKAILSVDMSSTYDSRIGIQKLDREFTTQIGDLLK